MGIAARKGKLTLSGSDCDLHELAWQRYEDVLTADIFGAYRYLPASLGLIPVLHNAVDERGQSFSAFLARFGIALSEFDVARIKFWPTLEDGREPDLFLLLESTATKKSIAVLAEVKFHAPQHEIDHPVGKRSQLGHYLIQHLAGGYAQGSIAWPLPDPAQPRPILFITKHTELPARELEQARFEANKACSTVPNDRLGVFWANWSTIGAEARRLWLLHRHRVGAEPWLRLLLDIYGEIKDRDLLLRTPFRGIPLADLRLPSRLYERRYIQNSITTHDLKRRIAAKTYQMTVSWPDIPHDIYRKYEAQ